MNNLRLESIWVNSRSFFLLLLTFILALYAAWMVNAQLGYGYAWLYHAYGIEEHIEKYAPHNRYRQGYQLTEPAEHKQHFQDIVDAVHNNGAGLTVINYSSPRGTVALLHEAEVIHLQDVANLINQIHYLVLVCFLLWLMLFIYQQYALKARPHQLASKQGLAWVFLVLSLTIALTFFTLGAKEIFYQLHIWIFPENHQWFFYYQESLMSTLMKAPDLFAGMAMQILLLGIVIFYVLLSLYFKLLFARRVLIK
jgi:hypothetical protein